MTRTVVESKERLVPDIAPPVTLPEKVALPLDARFKAPELLPTSKFICPSDFILPPAPVP